MSKEAEKQTNKEIQDTFEVTNFTYLEGEPVKKFQDPELH